MKKLCIILLTLSIVSAQDFNPGPYGIEYFDIAGPFHFPDLNNDNDILGDLNDDLQLNVEDIIIMIDLILNTDDDELDIIADINQDQGVNIQDITLLIGRILYPDSYIPENQSNFDFSPSSSQPSAVSHQVGLAFEPIYPSMMQ